MAGKGAHRNPVPVSDLVSDIVDPVLARRVGMTTGLIEAWDAIVGESLAERTRPERIRWAGRSDRDDSFDPAVLVIACEGSAALHVQHQTGEIIARVNAVLGFAAVDRVRIVQKPVGRALPRHAAEGRPLSPETRRRIAERVAAVDDEGLREALERLGRSVAASARR
jgi:hypothetical protein